MTVSVKGTVEWVASGRVTHIVGIRVSTGLTPDHKLSVLLALAEASLVLDGIPGPEMRMKRLVESGIVVRDKQAANSPGREDILDHIPPHRFALGVKSDDVVA